MTYYKGFYASNEENSGKDKFFNIRSIGVKYEIDKNEQLKFGTYGNGFHFTTTVSDVMSYFWPIVRDGEFKVAKIEVFGDIVQSPSEPNCFVTNSYMISQFLTHADLYNYIIKHIADEESVKTIGYYLLNLTDEEKKELLSKYFELLIKLSDDFDNNWRQIYVLYPAIMKINDILAKVDGKKTDQYAYYNARDIKTYAELISQKVRNHAIL